MQNNVNVSQKSASCFTIFTMQATLYNYFACTSSTQRASEKFILSQEKRSTHRKRKITEASKDKEVEYDSEGRET